MQEKGGFPDNAANGDDILTPAAERILVFCYGSNGTKQLRARIENNELRSHPAWLENYERVFCKSSSLWNGGVASLAPCEGSVTYGAVVSLTLEEKERLDCFEGSYRTEELKIKYGTPDCATEAEAFAYVAGQGINTYGSGHYTETMTTPPSQQYLTAIYCMLAEHWPRDVSSVITIASYETTQKSVASVSQWVLPQMKDLSLEALCVVINSQLEVPWTMPHTIGEFVGKLNAIGISSTLKLIRELAREGKSGLNPKLGRANQLGFQSSTLDTIENVLSTEMPPG